MFCKRGEGPPPRPPAPDPATGDPLATPLASVSDIHDDAKVAVYTDYRDLIASEVDYGTQRRIPKDSALFIQQVIAAHARDEAPVILTHR